MGSFGHSASREHRLLIMMGRSIDSMPTGLLWILVIFGVVTIAALDYRLQEFRLALAPLYMLPMCLASWRLGLLPGVAIAAAAAALPSLTIMASDMQLPSGSIVTNLVVHTLVLALVASIVASYRHSHDREAVFARHDRMTGVLNKQAFAEEAEAMLQAARSNKQILVLLYVDLDGFKAINDRHGHEAGDAILTSFANAAVALTRRCDRFGRIGGDEFAAMLAADTVEQARDLAQIAHSRFSAALSGGAYPTTCSIGALIVMADSTHDLIALWSEADQLMYAAKRAGKNRVKIARALNDKSEPPSLPVPEPGPVAIVPGRSAA